MKTRTLFAISGLLLLHLAAPQPCPAQTLLPTTPGTYYYEGYDSVNSRHAFISSTGTYYYVDNAGVTTVGGAAILPAAAPFRADITTSNTVITLINSTQFAGNVNIPGSFTFALTSASNPAATLAGNVSLAGIWRVPVKTTLNGNLAFTSPLGTIAIENARADSLTLSNGLTGNGCLDILSIDGSVFDVSEFRVIHDPTGTFVSATSTPLVLAHSLDYGLISYTLSNRPDGAYLVVGFNGISYNNVIAAVFNTRALIVEDWFASLWPVNNHFAQIRRSHAGIAPDAPRRLFGATLWLQASPLDTTNVNRSNKFLNFTSRTLSFTIGADMCWSIKDSSISIGALADTTRVDRDFIGSVRGRSTGDIGGLSGIGLYAHYHHRAGFHAAAIARLDAFEDTFDNNNPNNVLKARYRSKDKGISLEAGWCFELGRGWWLEPAASVGFASFPGVSYDTQSNRPGNIINISTTGVRAIQWLGRVAFGKSFGKNWLIRGHFALATINATGGLINTPGLSNADFTIAGTRAEISHGITRLLGRACRITLDASHTIASDYNRPCSLLAGWSWEW